MTLASELAMPLGGGEPFPTGEGELTDLGENCANGLELMLGQFKASETLRALICTLVTPLDLLQEAALAVHYDRWLTTAYGVQLDVLGRIIREPRNGAEDEDYRRALRTRVLINRSAGRIEELLEIATTYDPDLDVYEAREYPPNALVFWALGTGLTDERDLAERLRAAKGGGVALQLVSTPSGGVSSSMVSGDDLLVTSSTQGFGSTTEATGGALATVVAR